MRMARKRHTAEQLIAKLREAELALGKGQPLVDVVRKLEIPERYLHHPDAAAVEKARSA